MTRIDDFALKIFLVSLFLVFGVEGQIDIFRESFNDLVAFRQVVPPLKIMFGILLARDSSNIVTK